MESKKPKPNPLDNFAAEGLKECQMMCERDILMTPDGPVVVCHGCKRVVMDNRKKNDRRKN